jgi:hypothetical protein
VAALRKGRLQPIVIGSPEQQRAVIAAGNRLNHDHPGVAFGFDPEHIELGQQVIAQAGLMDCPSK